MSATTGGWHYVGNGDERASASISFSFEITLTRAGSLLTGKTTVPGPWSGEWGKRSSASGCLERSGAVRGAGGGGIELRGEFDTSKPDLVRISVDDLSVGTRGPATLEGFPSECPFFISGVGNLLFSSFFDCNEKKSCNTFKASGDSLSFGAAGDQLGALTREYLYRSGGYNGTAQLTLVSEIRR